MTPEQQALADKLTNLQRLTVLGAVDKSKMENDMDEVTVTVRDYTETGWWVDPDQWFRQEVFPLTGCWSIAKTKSGKIIRACILSGYDGWHDTGYRPVRIEKILKPSKWFAAHDDMRGKVEEYKAYRHEVLYSRKTNILRVSD